MNVPMAKPAVAMIEPVTQLVITLIICIESYLATPSMNVLSESLCNPTSRFLDALFIPSTSHLIMSILWVICLSRKAEIGEI